MNDQGEVLQERQGGVAVLRLHRPERRNALSATMLAQLRDALDDIARTPDIRSVVLLGAPGFFCAGADISAYHGATAAELETFTHAALDVVDRLRTLPVPTVIGVDGLALGGGLELVLAADIVLASERASFGLPETSIGLIPGWRGTRALAAAVGVRRAKHLIYTGERFSAAEAHAWGLVLEVVDDVDAAALSLGQNLSTRAPLAVRAAKRAIDADNTTTETRELLALFATADGVEGVAAFVAKRPPHFTGH